MVSAQDNSARLRRQGPEVRLTGATGCPKIVAQRNILCAGSARRCRAFASWNKVEKGEWVLSIAPATNAASGSWPSRFSPPAHWPTRPFASALARKPELSPTSTTQHRDNSQHRPGRRRGLNRHGIPAGQDPGPGTSKDLQGARRCFRNSARISTRYFSTVIAKSQQVAAGRLSPY